MKKYLSGIAAALVLLVGLSSEATAQTADYSCGAYGEGSYSKAQCDTQNSDDTSGGDQGSKDTDTTTEGSLEGVTDENTNGKSEPPANGRQNNQEDAGTEHDEFAVAPARLVDSWGWLVFFGALILGGVILIGWTWRKKRAKD